MNLSNSLTLLRTCLAPVLVVVLITRREHGLWAGAGIFAAGVLTDYLDGYLARRRGQVTRLGILLDPLADKLLTSAAFIGLVQLNAAPAWGVWIIIGREFLVTGLRNVASLRGVLIPASALGKGKMVLQVLAIFALLGKQRFELLRLPAAILFWSAVAVALISGAAYMEQFRRLLVGKGSPGSDSSSATPKN